MLAPLSNNIWTISLCPFPAAKNKKEKSNHIQNTEKKSQKSCKINVFKSRHMSVFWLLLGLGLISQKSVLHESEITNLQIMHNCLTQKRLKWTI